MTIPVEFYSRYSKNNITPEEAVGLRILGKTLVADPCRQNHSAYIFQKKNIFYGKKGISYNVGNTRNALTFCNTAYSVIILFFEFYRLLNTVNHRLRNSDRKIVYSVVRAIRPDKGLPACGLIEAANRYARLLLRKSSRLKRQSS